MVSSELYAKLNNQERKRMPHTIKWYSDAIFREHVTKWAGHCYHDELAEICRDLCDRLGYKYD